MSNDGAPKAPIGFHGIVGADAYILPQASLESPLSSEMTSPLSQGGQWGFGKIDFLLHLNPFGKFGFVEEQVAGCYSLQILRDLHCLPC